MNAGTMLIQVKRFLISCVAMLAITGSYAQTTITSTAAGGPWNVGSTWVGGVVPSQASNNHAVIAAGATVTVPVTPAASCVNLTVNGNLNLTGTGNTLSIGNPGSNLGSLTLGAGSNVFIGEGNTLEFRATQTGAGIVNNGGTIASTGINGADGGTIVTNANSGGGFSITGSAATVINNLTFVQNATFNIATPSLLINGTFIIPNNNWNWNGASISPTYGPGSTLYINRGNQGYAQNKEWSANTGTIGVTPGYPNNVILVNMGSSVFNGTGWHPTGTLGLNGTLQVGDATTNGRITLEDVTTFNCGGILVANNSLIIGPKTGATFINRGNFSLEGGATGVFQNMGAPINFAGSGTSAAPQIIRTTGASVQFTNMIVSNGTYVRPEDPTSVSGTLTLTSGYVGTNMASLTITNTATTGISGGSATAYVDGPLAWSIPATTTNNYTFPIGDLSGGAYLPLTLSPNTTSGATVTATAFNENSQGTPGPSVTSISQTEYWSVTTSSPFSSGPLVSVTRPADVDPNNALAISATSNGVYNAIGGTPTTKSIDGGGIGTSSPIFITMVEAPLSVVKLSGLNVTCNGTLGSLTVGGSGGDAPYTYSINDGAFQPTGVFASLPAGKHKVTVRDDAGTEASDSLIVLGSVVINGDGKDMKLCPGQTQRLTAQNLQNASPSYSWSDSDSGTPVLGTSSFIDVNPTVTTTYYVTSTLYTNNLVTNGSFESGSSGFTSSYTNYIGAAYGTTPGNNGYYSISSAGNTQCIYFTTNNAVGGPTLPAQSGGLFFVGDGAIASSMVWSQTVTGLTLGNTYKFQFYYAAANPDATRAVLRPTINGGASLGDITTNNATAWTQATYNWVATSTSATLTLTNMTATGNTNGNDFLIDNIELLEPCVVTSAIKIISECPCTTPATPVINGVTASCVDSILNFSTNATANNLMWTFVTSGTGTITTSPSLAAISLNAGNATGKLILQTTVPGNINCFAKDSVNITLRPQEGVVADAGSDFTPCLPTVNLSANDPGVYSGVWTLQSGTAVIDDPASPTTEISGIATNATLRWTITGTCGFTSSDEVIVTEGSGGNNLVANTGEQGDTLCDGSNVDLRVEGSGGSGDYQYHWYSADGSLNETTSSSILNVTPPAGTTVYYVEVIDRVQVGCSSQRDTITIFSTSTQELIIPNLLTPNGDEKNDLFEVRDVNQIELLPGSSLTVTNRWGDSVYKSSSYDNTWNPNALSDGVYYYYLKAGCGAKEYKGWVQVVR